jgi:hypothetical protein
MSQCGCKRSLDPLQRISGAARIEVREIDQLLRFDLIEEQADLVEVLFQRFVIE